MTPGSEALTALPEAAPSLFWATLRMLALLAAFLGGAWLLLRWQRRTRSGGRQVEVVERAFLARGSSLTLVRVDGRRLLLGVSSEGVRLLRDLDGGGAEGRFPDVLSEVAGEEVRG